MVSGDTFVGDKRYGDLEQVNALMADVKYLELTVIRVIVDGRMVALNPRHIESVQWMPVP